MKNAKFWLIGIALVGIILRFSVSLLGYHGDLNNNISWGEIAYDKGLNGFYGSDDANEWPFSAPNQPPLTILMFGFVHFIWQNITDLTLYLNSTIPIFPSGFVWFWEQWGRVLTVKLPSILADLGLGFLIYYYIVNKLKKSIRLGLMLFSVWVFNPVTWYNSAVWGQTDSIVNLIGLLAILSLMKRKLNRFTVLFTMSFLFKGSLGIFIPVLSAYVIIQKYPLKKMVVAMLYGLFTMLFVSIWFHPYLDLPVWLYNLYTTRILPGEIGYLSANAFNFWWLVDSGNVYDSVHYLGLSARVWGIVLTLLVNGIAVYWLSKKPYDLRFIASLLIVSLASFLFMTRIHERYLYPFFPISTLWLFYAHNYWLIYLLYSLIHLLNLYNLFWVPGIIGLENLLTFNWFTNSLAAINIVLFMATLLHLKRFTK